MKVTPCVTIVCEAWVTHNPTTFKKLYNLNCCIIAMQSEGKVDYFKSKLQV